MKVLGGMVFFLLLECSLGLLLPQEPFWDGFFLCGGEEGMTLSLRYLF